MTCVIEATPLTLQQAILSTYTLLQNFAKNPDFIPTLETVFGCNLNTSVVLTLGQSWRRGNFQDLPYIEVCPASQINGAMGKFVKASNTIYLSQEFLTFFANDPEIITAVLLEEIGNYLNMNLNCQENLGHQGVIFADLVQGYPLREFRL